MAKVFVCTPASAEAHPRTVARRRLPRPRFGRVPFESVADVDDEAQFVRLTTPAERSLATRRPLWRLGLPPGSRATRASGRAARPLWIQNPRATSNASTRTTARLRSPATQSQRSHRHCLGEGASERANRGGAKIEYRAWGPIRSRMASAASRRPVRAICGQCILLPPEQPSDRRRRRSL